MRCAYYCTTESYHLDELTKFLRNEGWDPKFYGDVIHIDRHEDDSGDIFLFGYGCIAFWGFEEAKELETLEKLKAFETNSLPAFIVDACSFVQGDENHIDEENDEIVLDSSDPLVKLSLSHGLTQSVKLQAFEDLVDQTIERTRRLPQELSTKGRTSLSRHKLSQQIGELFALRNSINLHGDILDMPEFFWRRPRYEPYYHMASNYMDISTRLDILNRRLDVIHELYDILSDQLKHSHSSRLEWVVIGLIITEVLLHILEILLPKHGL